MQRDLVERAMAGDRDAFTELARASFGRLHAVARLIIRDQARAEDATQEALTTAWRRLPGLRDPDRFDAWLQRLLVNACHREVRTDRRHGRLEINIDPLALPEPADATGLDVDLAVRDQLERGFRRLNVDQRTVLVMHYYLGFSLDEAGEVLGVPPGTVRSRLNRAIAAMRAALEADARASQLSEGHSV
jgi:RNA polymerase sigma-70 factor (ECF subfamily)